MENSQIFTSHRFGTPASGDKEGALFLSLDMKRFVIIYMITTDQCMGMGAYQIITTDINNRPIKEQVCTHD